MMVGPPCEMFVSTLDQARKITITTHLPAFAMSDSNNGGAAAGVAEAAAVVSPPDTVQGSSVLTHLPVSTTQVLLVLAPAVMLSAAFRLGDLAECLLGSLSGSGSGSSASGRMSFVRTLVDACTRLAFVLAAAFAAEYAPVYEHEVGVCLATL